jgi:hypothetical protein
MCRLPMHRFAHLALAGILCVSAATSSVAQSSDDEGFLNIAAHSHGKATLTVIISGEQLALGFESPAFNLLGFESVPATPVEEAALARAVTVLASVANLMKIADASCEVRDLQISRPGQDEHEGHTHDEAGHDGHEHAAGGHWEFQINAALHCVALPARPTLTATVFEHFSGIETLELLWATDTQQGAATLTAAQPSTTLN